MAQSQQKSSKFDEEQVKKKNPRPRNKFIPKKSIHIDVEMHYGSTKEWNCSI